MSNKIYHLFKASSYLLVKQMISNFLHYTSNQHHFIIFLDSDEWKSKYELLFADLGCYGYEYISEADKVEQSFLSMLKHPVIYRGTEGCFSKAEKVLYSYLEHCSYPNLLIHGDYMFFGKGFYRALFLSKIKCKAWVCWGAIPARNKKSFYYRITYGYYRDMFFTSCRFINTLLEGDQADFRLLKFNKNITLCPYIIDTPKIATTDKIKQNTVLIGNSGLYVDSYESLLPRVKHKNIHFTFMMSYGCDEKQKEEFQKKASSFLGSNFELWTENFAISEYLKKVSSFSIYICNVERQTGLGAIQACLSLGIRCYLRGKNLEHFQFLGFRVHSVEELNEEKGWNNMFSNEYEKEITYNKKQWMKVFDPVLLGKQWNLLFRLLKN